MNHRPESTEPTPDPQMGALLAEAGWVLALAKRLARDQAAAEDIAQSTLALALERRPALEGGLRPWLAMVVGRLARHTVRDETRRQKREARAVPAGDSHSIGTDEVLERFELQQDLVRRVRELDEPYRSVLIRRYYEGLSVKEIARATGASPGTVRSRLARGLERLRLQYDHDYEDHGALGIFLLVAGSGTGFISRRTAELALMQTSTKVVAATAVTILIALAVIAPKFGRADSVHEDGTDARPMLVERTTVEGEANSVAIASPGESGRVPARVGVVAADSVVAAPVEELASAVTILRARILGEHGESLAGATLRSIHHDGRPRGAKSVAYSGGDGRVVLELADDAVRKWRDRPFDMLFAVDAAEHATSFTIKQLRLHGETDLGEIRLRPGGGLVGISVDEEGLPIAGAVLFAGASVLTDEPETQRLMGPDSNVPRPRAISAADGSFELAGIQAFQADGSAASTRIWAHSPGRLWTLSEPFTISPYGLVDVGRIVLEEVPSELRIEGTVVRPDGSPVPGARVAYFSKGRPYEGEVEADARGHFLVVARDGAALDFVARGREGSDDSAGEFGASTPVTAQRGERLELRLTQRRRIAVTVIDTEGEPVHDAHLMPVLLDGLVPGEDWRYVDEAGHVTIDPPGGRFMVWVRKTGYGSVKSGIIEHDTAPEELTLTMTKGAHLTGRVFAYGEPVEGASVSVMRRLVDFAAMTGGFSNRYTSDASGILTDAEGRLTAPLKHNWTKVGAVARLEGLATGEAAVDVWSGESVDYIEIHMTDGGALEGTVIPPPGMQAAGLFVAASRGDGSPFSTIVDASGRYRFEGLTPGDWRVEGRLREAGTELLSTSWHAEDVEPRWNAVVVDRETTEFNVDMSNLGDVEVRGQLRIDGAAPPRGWTLTVARPRHEHNVAETSAVELDREGRFVLTTRPGRADLRFVGTLPGETTIEMLRAVRVQGPLFEWTGELFTAPVDEWLDGEPDRARFLRGRADASDRELTIVPVGEDGVVTARVPIGRSNLQVPAQSDSSDKSWESVRTIDVP